MRDADYLIIGAGAVGLSFADTLINESDATVAIVDKRAKPGGHWNDAYDFVRLHQPSAFYGVNSIELGQRRKDVTGPNTGLYELAGAPEILSYFEDVMTNTLLASGRVTYYPEHEYCGNGSLLNLKTNATEDLGTPRKVVDATFYRTTIPALHTPSFAVSDTVTLIPPNGLEQTLADDAHDWEHICILGGGKTSMDVAVELLRQGRDPETVSWVRPRDAWYMNRKHMQPGSEFFHDTIGMQAQQLEAIATAQTSESLFEQLEAEAQMLRMDASFAPQMFHCAIASTEEIRLAGSISNVIRKGHVKEIGQSGLVLTNGHQNMPARTLYVDCTACAVERRPAKPIFDGGLITPQMIRMCQPTFSAALTAHIALQDYDEEHKNALCQVIPAPRVPADFLPATMTNMMNQYMWQRDPRIRQWLLNSRLDAFSNIMNSVDPQEADKVAVLDRFRKSVAPAIGNLHALMARG